MDVLAHTLWANAGAKKLNNSLKRKNKPPISIRWASFWGVFPDIFAFGLPVFLSIFSILRGYSTFNDFSHHGQLDNYGLSNVLYNYSHSLIIFLVVFSIVSLITKKFRWEMLGWALHIFLDIPTHSVKFFPTPFLFPISKYVFPNGFSWAEPWFMVLNYGSLVFVLYLLYKKQNKTT